MRIAWVTAVLFVLPLSTACEHKPPQRTAFVFNHGLQQSLVKYDESWSVARPAIVFEKSGVARDCASFSNLISRAEPGESVSNQAIRSEYLECDALKLLSGAAIVAEGAPADVGAALLSKLDLRSFPSSLFQMSDDAKHTLATLYPENSRHAGPVATLETNDWVFRLEVAAATRINNNATPDWIVWLSDEAKQGNYRSYLTLIIYDPGEQSGYVATVYP